MAPSRAECDLTTKFFVFFPPVIQLVLLLAARSGKAQRKSSEGRGATIELVSIVCRVFIRHFVPYRALACRGRSNQDGRAGKNRMGLGLF